jgi:hypothetical protein
MPPAGPGLFPTAATDNEVGVFHVSRTAILDAVRALPAEKQQETLSHAARLRDEAVKKRPFNSVRGLWADLVVSLSAGEIEDHQRDM